MNRQRFMVHNLARKFFDRVIAEALDRKLVSNDHFTVDGTLGADTGYGADDFLLSLEVRAIEPPVPIRLAALPVESDRTDAVEALSNQSTRAKERRASHRLAEDGGRPGTNALRWPRSNRDGCRSHRRGPQSIANDSTGRRVIGQDTLNQENY